MIANDAEKLGLAAERLRDARLNAVLLGAHEQRSLIVEGTVAGGVGPRIVAEERSRLRTDAILGNHVTRERQARRRIEDLNRAPGRIDELRKVTGTLEDRRHQRRLCLGTVIR